MAGFEELYIQLRNKEQRLYSDAEVSQLPATQKNHLYAKEWKIRAESCKRLIKYLEQKEKPLRILEIGCGNGWLAANLADINGATVTGIDTNQQELKQAERVFGNKSNLVFKAETIQAQIAQHKKYDVIIFAASIQYFSSLREIINEAFLLLSAYGEIHILDSHFYKPGQVDAASIRSKTYFQKMGFEEMTNHYYHHTINEAKRFKCRVLYNPNNIIRKFTWQKNPFYWLRITP